MANSADVMIDLETTGTSPGCGILSIGACTFDGIFEFYEKINPTDNFKWRLESSMETLAWWNKQDIAAKREAFSGTKDLVEVLGNFSDYILRVSRNNGNAEVFVWGNGADFDNPILAKAYEVVEMKQPWKPYNGRCYRTLKNLYPQIKMEKFEGMKHNALDDAKMQARHALAILRERKRQNLIVSEKENQVPQMNIYP